MKLLVLLAAAAVCAGAPQMLQPLPYIPSPAIAYTSSLTPAVTKIQRPGVQLHFPANVRFVAPAPVAQPVVQAVPHPVQYQAPTVAVAPAPVASPVVVAAAPEPLNAPEPPMPAVGTPFVGGQFHAQDELKQYSFGHWGGPSTRVETRDALGRTKGSFAYVNPKGDVHVRKYAAAPAMGFKVAASDLPDDTPAVASLKAAHEKSFRTIKEMIMSARA
ncbi:cuticle protein 7-like [Portunus trituberculatus]|uniref:cuticle protein 7-like n=1 Tax=Portunus trituberculatus TaxID=210409 RepID=UPI001E1CDD6D|nr:cuticle protein 7-like [Portunus trituberculatus]